jgi:cobalamin biosynthesis protein CbiD
MEHEAKEPHGRKRATTNEAPEALEPSAGFDTAEALNVVTAYAKENPHVALAAAAGVGFLLGGGLTPRILGAAALFVGRRYVNLMIRDAIQGALQGQRGLSEG